MIFSEGSQIPIHQGISVYSGKKGVRLQVFSHNANDGKNHSINFNIGDAQSHCIECINSLTAKLKKKEQTDGR
jgi:hypothetical protein